VYRVRDNVIEQLTFDHSLVWEMAAAGEMTREEVPAYIPKNVITRSLGPHETVHLDLEGPYNAAVNDIFLLCSDGLSGQVSDEELGAILQCMSPEEAAQTLVDLANLRGGPDNISVIVARVVSGAPPLPDDLEASPSPSFERTSQWSKWPWIICAVCLAALLFCLANQYWIGATASALGLAGALLTGLAGRAAAGLRCPPVGPLGGPYGNGPYRKTSCEPGRKLVDTLAELATKVRELPEREPGDWKLDWGPFDGRLAEAAAAAESGDRAAAIRQYSQALREIMKQLRERRPSSDARSFDGLPFDGRPC
jgi:protein phosphatase